MKNPNVYGRIPFPLRWLYRRWQTWRAVRAQLAADRARRAHGDWWLCAGGHLGHRWRYDAGTRPAASGNLIGGGAPSRLACARCGTDRNLGLRRGFARQMRTFATFVDEPGDAPLLGPPSDAPRFGVS